MSNLNILIDTFFNLMLYFISQIFNVWMYPYNQLSKYLFPGVKGQNDFRLNRTRNWCKNIKFTPNSKIDISNLKKLMNKIRKMDKIRAIGSGHSMNKILDSDNVVTMRRFHNILNIDIKKKEIKVEAGARIYEITTKLAEYNLALYNTGDIDEQELAGYMATDSHGSSWKRVPTDDIIEIEVIDHNGDLIRVDNNGKKATVIIDNQGRYKKVLYWMDKYGHKKSHNYRDGIITDDLRALKVHLGAFGIVYSYKLKCYDLFYLKKQVKIVNFENDVININTYLNQHRHVSYITIPYTKYAIRYLMLEITQNQADTEKINLINNCYILLERFVTNIVVVYAIDVIPLASNLMKYGWMLMGNIFNFAGLSYYKAGPGFTVTPTLDNLTNYNTRKTQNIAAEYMIPFNKLNKLKAVLKKYNYMQTFPIDVRFNKGNPSVYMTTMPGNTICVTIPGVLTKDNVDYMNIVKQFEKDLIKLKPLPHHGKVFLYTYPQVFKKWRINKWHNVRKIWDPKNKFMNNYLLDKFEIKH